MGMRTSERLNVRLRSVLGAAVAETEAAKISRPSIRIAGTGMGDSLQRRRRRVAIDQKKSIIKKLFARILLMEFTVNKSRMAKPIRFVRQAARLADHPHPDRSAVHAVRAEVLFLDSPLR